MKIYKIFIWRHSMKKYNLKRFLASLLAVLMLASVTGVSPAVFAEDSATPPSA